MHDHRISKDMQEAKSLVELVEDLGSMYVQTQGDRDTIAAAISLIEKPAPAMVPWRWGNPVEHLVPYLVWDMLEGWAVARYLEGEGWMWNHAAGDSPIDYDLIPHVTMRSSEPLPEMKEDQS